MRWVGPLSSGVAGAVIAGLASWIYLASIEIDDGLEALMFLPILAVVLLAIGTMAGLRRADMSWPALAALGSVATTAFFPSRWRSFGAS